MTVPRTDEPLALKVALSFKLAILSTWSSNLDMLVFEERGKLQGYPEKKNRQEKQQQKLNTQSASSPELEPMPQWLELVLSPVTEEKFSVTLPCYQFFGGISTNRVPANMADKNEKKK